MKDALVGGEILRLRRRETREAPGGPRIGFEDIVFHIERGDLLDILEPPRPEPSLLHKYAAGRLNEI